MLNRLNYSISSHYYKLSIRKTAYWVVTIISLILNSFFTTYNIEILIMLDRMPEIIVFLKN